MKSETIYIACPGFHKTGGTELLHQLAHALNAIGARSVMAYYGPYTNKGINPAFKTYISNYTKIAKLDNSNGTLIVPETNMSLMRQFPKMRKIIWWMSVDNFLAQRNLHIAHKTNGLRGIVNYIWNKPGNIFNAMKSADAHLCQSHYAIEFLIEQGIDSNNIHRLSDYINDIYLDEPPALLAQERVARVLYNPRKGARFTTQLINTPNDIQWLALEGYSNDELRGLYRTSRVYIDFGNHPGKDRIPREAAASGCCVITGRRGSAGNPYDIPIPDRYKIEECEESIPLILGTILSCCEDYDAHIDSFADYRTMIASERSVFFKDVATIFGNQ